MKTLIAAMFLASVIGHSTVGRHVDRGAPPPAACGADTSLITDYTDDIKDYLTLTDQTAKGLPYPPAQGSIVHVTTKSTCSSAITAFNSAFPAGHPGRLTAGVYVFKIGTTRYAIAKGNLLHFYTTGWTLLLAATTLD
jgi:hypothetical protein